MNDPPAAAPPDVATAPRPRHESDLTNEVFKHAFLDNLCYIQSKFPAFATDNDDYLALAHDGLPATVSSPTTKPGGNFCFHRCPRWRRG